MNKQQPSRNKSHTRDVTMNPNPSAAEGGMPSEGEGMGVGSTYSAVLNERPNKSINRNNGIDRPSANTGMIPGVTKAQRKTGRV
jgi:hypothetical protein